MNQSSPLLNKTMSVRRVRANRLAEVVNAIRLLNTMPLREWQEKYPALYRISVSQPLLVDHSVLPRELVMIDNLRTELQLRTAEAMLLLL